MNLPEIEQTIREYLKAPVLCTRAPLSRECEHFGALVQVAADFRVDFRLEPWKTALRLMPRRGLAGKTGERK